MIVVIIGLVCMIVTLLQINYKKHTVCLRSLNGSIKLDCSKREENAEKLREKIKQVSWN